MKLVITVSSYSRHTFNWRLLDHQEQTIDSGSERSVSACANASTPAFLDAIERHKQAVQEANRAANPDYQPLRPRR